MSDRTSRGRIQRSRVTRQTRSTTARMGALAKAAAAAAPTGAAPAARQPAIADIPRISSFATIASNYQVLLVDLFGTLWDGKTSFPIALDSMRDARRAGIKVILLSNTPRPNDTVSGSLAPAGIGADCYDALLTSGEAARTMLAGLGNTKIFFIGPDKNASVFAGLDNIERVATPAEADLVLNTGPPTEYNVGEPMPAVDAILKTCLDAGLPMVCVNPDLEVKRDGQLWGCAGELMKRYTSATPPGTASNYGKPYVEVFDTALAGLDVDRSKVLMIGDGVGTDMLGAKNAGVHGLWIIGTGIHAAEVGEDQQKISALAARNGVAPVAWMQELKW